jgi:phage gp46-like protein
MGGLWDSFTGAYADPMVKAVQNTQAKKAFETSKLVDDALAKVQPESPAPDFMSGILSPTRTEGPLPSPAPDDAKLRAAAATIPRPSSQPMQADPLAAKMAALDSTGPGTGGSGPAQGDAPSVPAPTATPKAPGKSPEEMAFDAAQKASDDMGTRSTISNILGAFTSDSAGIQKRNAEARQKPLQDLANKYNYLQQVRENKAKNAQAQRQADMGDPSSPLTKRNAAMLYAAYGIKPSADFTADQTADYVAASKLKGEQREKELSRLREEARDKATEAHEKASEGLTRRGQDINLQMERERGKTALAEKQLAAAAAKHATTPALAAELPKVSNISGAGPAIDELMAAHKNIGPIEKGISALTGGALNIGDAGKYERLKATKVGPLATALYPLAKGENPELLKAAAAQLPDVAGFEGNAQDKLRQLKRTTGETKENFISGLEAAGLDPAQAAQLRAVGGAPAGAGPELPAGTGPVQIRAPNGKIKLIPRDQVQAALADHGELVEG